jgi:hypothetical protein
VCQLSWQCHLDINADANAWAKWASARGINPMLIAYNRYRAQEYHHKFSATDNAYPTPRSWTASHQVLRLDLPEALKRECTGGMIGPSASADFAGFCDIYTRLPDVSAIVADPDRGIIPSDPMTSHALMGALAKGFVASLPRCARPCATRRDAGRRWCSRRQRSTEMVWNGQDERCSDPNQAEPEKPLD